MLVDCPTQLIYIWIFICFKTNTKRNTAGLSARHLLYPSHRQSDQFTIIVQLVQNDRSDATDWQDCEETTAAPDPNGFDYDADDDFNLKFSTL